MARVASSGVSKQTKPKPRDGPLGSLTMTCEDMREAIMPELHGIGVDNHIGKKGMRKEKQTKEEREKTQKEEEEQT